jgi:hypothetical protein
MSIGAIGIQTITAQSGIGPQTSPQPTANDKESGETAVKAASAAEPRSASPPETSKFVDKTA